MPVITKKILAIIVVAITATGIGIGTGLGIYFGTDYALNNAAVNISGVDILSTNQNTINVQITGTISNPAGIPATLGATTLTVTYQNINLGTTQITGMAIGASGAAINQIVDITITNFTHFSNFMKDFIEQATVNLQVRGVAPITAVGLSVNKAITKTITLNGMNNQFNITVNGFSIINATSTTVTVNVTTNVTNPSSVNINLQNVKFNVSWNGSALGQLNISQMAIITGSHNISTIGTIYLENVTHYQEMVNSLLAQNDIELELTGITSGNNILDAYINGLQRNVTLPGLKPFDVAILSIDLTNSSTDAFWADVGMVIFNPINGTVNIQNINFTVNHSNQELGIVVFPNLNVDSGTHAYNVSVKFTLTNLTLLSEILTDYLNGEDVTLLFIGNASSTDAVSAVLNNYQENVTLPALVSSIEYGISDLNFKNSTANMCIFNTTLNVTNPSDLNVTLNITLNATYEGSWIGNLTITNENLSPGVNLLEVEVILSDEENRTAVEDFLSNYMNGTNTNITLSGNASIQIAGMVSTLNTTLNFEIEWKGLQGNLIQSITLVSISVTYYPPGSLSFTANARVTVQNPLNFSINITYLEYDVYFDDPDGYSIPIPIPPYSYSDVAAYNIFIDDVAKNYTQNPPEVQFSAGETRNLDEAVSNNTQNVCSRLYDEYVQDNDLLIDIRNGIMQIALGDFKVMLEFNFENQVVS